jgi:hypothetical protein
VATAKSGRSEPRAMVRDGQGQMGVTVSDLVGKKGAAESQQDAIWCTEFQKAWRPAC